MSSTKRGGQRSPADNYPTPNWCVHRFLEEWPPKGERLPPGRWLDPGAGEGNIIYAAKEWVEENYTAPPDPVNLRIPPPETFIWDAVELRSECQPYLEKVGSKVISIGDYFEKGPPTPEFYQAILTNPPFSIAPQFIERSLDSNCRFVIMLLRLNYLGSETRHSFMRSHAPDLYVLPNRPSFKLTGETDSIEYAWFVWDKENLNRNYGSIRVLALTPLEERKKEHARLRGLGLFYGEDARKRPSKKRTRAEVGPDRPTCAKCGSILGESGDDWTDDCPFCYPE